MDPRIVVAAILILVFIAAPGAALEAVYELVMIPFRIIAAFVEVAIEISRA